MRNFGLFFFRVLLGLLMLVGHGAPKIGTAFSAIGAEGPLQFPDPLGIGAWFSLLGAIGAEFFCAVLIIVGLLTRVAAVPLVFTMLVGAFLVHAGDPLFPQFLSGIEGAPAEYATLLTPFKEYALLYALGFGLLIFTGPGLFSLDRKFFGKRKAETDEESYDEEDEEDALLGPAETTPRP